MFALVLPQNSLCRAWCSAPALSLAHMTRESIHILFFLKNTTIYLLFQFHKIFDTSNLFPKVQNCSKHISSLSVLKIHTLCLHDSKAPLIRTNSALAFCSSQMHLRHRHTPCSRVRKAQNCNPRRAMSFLLCSAKIDNVRFDVSIDPSRNPACPAPGFSLSQKLQDECHISCHSERLKN